MFSEGGRFITPSRQQDLIVVVSCFTRGHAFNVQVARYSLHAMGAKQVELSKIGQRRKLYDCPRFQCTGASLQLQEAPHATLI